MAFEELLVSIVSQCDKSGFDALDRLETKASAKTDILSRKMKHLFVGVIGTMSVKSIMDANVKLDTLRRSMSALAGSEIGGAEQIAYLREESERLGQNFIGISESYKNLFSAGIGTGLDVNSIQSVFSSVLEAGTVLGSSKQQLEGALLALEQMLSKGKVSMEGLRKQLGNALPGAMQIAARAMGVTSEQFQQMIKKGMNSKEFVTAFARQLHSEFGTKATAAAHTLRAEIERLNNAIFDLKTSFLNEEDSEELAKSISQIAKIISSPVFKESLQGIGHLAMILIKNIRWIIGIAVFLGFRKLIDTLAILRLEFLTTSFAAGSLGAALQMDAGIASMTALIKILWAGLTVLLRWLAILALILEIVDTLRGKKTVTGEIIGNMPTFEEFFNSQKFNKWKIDFGMHMPWHKDSPILNDSGLYDNKGNPKKPGNNIYKSGDTIKDDKKVAYNFGEKSIIIQAPGGDANVIAANLGQALGQILKDYNETRFDTISPNNGDMALA